MPIEEVVLGPEDNVTSASKLLDREDFWMRELCSIYPFVRYLRGRIKAGTHGLSAVERAYGRLWSMADRTWQIEHRT